MNWVLLYASWRPFWDQFAKLQRAPAAPTAFASASKFYTCPALVLRRLSSKPPSTVRPSAVVSNKSHCSVEARCGPNNCLIDAAQLSLNYVTCCTRRCCRLFAHGDAVTTAPSQLVQRESARWRDTFLIFQAVFRLSREALAPEIARRGKLENRISRNGRGLSESFSREDSSELGCTRFRRGDAARGERDRWREREREEVEKETTRLVTVWMDLIRGTLRNVHRIRISPKEDSHLFRREIQRKWKTQRRNYKLHRRGVTLLTESVVTTCPTFRLRGLWLCMNLQSTISIVLNILMRPFALAEVEN